MALRSGVIVASHHRCTIYALQPNSAVVSLVAHGVPRTLAMETPPLHTEASASPARSQSTQARLEFKSVDISTRLTTRRETTDEELELIEMRYQQALALMNLECLFADG